MKVKVTRQELAAKPVSPLIYGNFIEAGFGRQTEGMWAEMFFNRSFERVPPYLDSLWGSMGCKPGEDLAVYPFWHSGYEENEWYLVPGNADAKWAPSLHISFHHGQQSGWLKNDSAAKWAGFAQDGIVLRKGERYTFSGWMKTGTHPWDLRWKNLTLDAEVRIYPEGDFSEPVLVHKVGGITKAYECYEWTFTCEAFEGRATFSLWIPPKSGLLVDDFSLMPASNLDGWRADVIEAARRINAPIIRWPGGCFASFYHWRQGVGPRADRVPTESWFWGGLYDNDVGTAEFIRFCRLLGTEPFICVNMLTGSPDEAAEWVAYCNAPVSHPMGALRAKHGFAEPFGVTYWELDNEAFRRFGHREYAGRCVEFARAMRAADPTIKLAMVGYDSYNGVIGELLEIAGAHVDFIVDRAIDEAPLRRDLEVIASYNAAAGTAIRLCNTEWPAPVDDLPPGLSPADLEPFPTMKCKELLWYSALNVAKTLLTFQRLGGDFAFSNFNNYANTWGQNVIECAKEGVCLSAVGRVMELFSRSPAAWPLKIEGDALPEGVHVQAAWDAGRTSLCLVVLNGRGEEVEVTFGFGSPAKPFSVVESTVLRAPSLVAHNTLAQPETITGHDATARLTPSGRGTEHTIVAAPYSICHCVVR
ncbi:MAG: hypothetical protein JW889_07005 [Verrucomicrobia bacterium]|nr:hypothetical protein [Verrucomicrobiota bacterium]